MTIPTVRLMLITRYSLLLPLLLLFLMPSALADDSVWVRIHHGADEPRLAMSGVADSLADYGSFQWGELPSTMVRDLKSRGLRLTVIENPFELRLGGQRFDPLDHFPVETRDVNPEHSDFQLVQFEGPMRGQWLQSLGAAGVEVVQYVHPHTYIVWANGDQMQSITNGPGVRWTGVFAPEFRVVPDQRGFTGSEEPTMLAVSSRVDEKILAEQVEAVGGEVIRIIPYTAHLKLLVAKAPGARFLDLGHIPGVYTVQRAMPMKLRGEMSNQAIVGNHGGAPDYTIFPDYSDWLTDTGYNGSGVIVSIMDSGVRSTHVDLADRMLPCVPSASPSTCSSSISNHGTHVGGAVAGTGATGTRLQGFLRGQGVAPGANLISQVPPNLSSWWGSACSADHEAGEICQEPDGMLRLFKEAATNGAILANNSWGSGGFQYGYDLITQQVDVMVRDADPDTLEHEPVLPLWSIQNGGGDMNTGSICDPSSLGSPEEAKNAFAVGASRLQNSSSGTQVSGSQIFSVGQNSAHGPACDGRTNPDIVAPGWRTDSTLGSSNTAHGLMGGTSMASPVMSGASAIFIEYYRDLHEGATPSPAMIKAAFTARAINMHGQVNADNGPITETPSRFQGWGRLDLDAVINPPSQVIYFDQEHVFTQTGQQWTLPVIADDPGEPVHLMLMWTDFHGHGLSGDTQAWVNLLDLSVEAVTGSYLGNQIGPDGFSQTGGDPDDRNNMEGVFLRADQHNGNSFEVTVQAAQIVADALNPWNPDMENPTQDFALVCYNCQEGNPTFTLGVDPESIAMCLPESGSVDESVDVTVGIESDYAGTVALSASGEPTGVSSQFVPAAVEAPGQSTWTLSVDASASAGASAILLTGDDGGEIKDLPLTLTVEVPPDGPDLLSPAPDAVDVSPQPELSWSAIEGVNNYQLQVATDPQFDDIVVAAWINQTNYMPSSMLEVGTDYFWRVRGLHACGDGGWSETRQFRTRFDPVAGIEPDNLSAAVPMDGQETLTLSIGNVGFGTLEWSISTGSCAEGGPVDWLSVNPTSGTVDAEQTDPVDVNIDTQGLAAGLYSGALCVTTNQPEVDPVSVPVALEVLELPPGDSAITPTSLGYGDVGTGTSVTLPVNIMNVAEEGSADVVISQIGIISGGAVYSIKDTDCPASLAPQAQCTVEVQFSPAAITAYSGVLRIILDGQSTNVGLLGNGSEPVPEVFQDRFEPQ